MSKPTHFVLVYKDPSGVHQTPQLEIKHLPYMLHNCVAWSQPAILVVKVIPKKNIIDLHPIDRIITTQNQ